MQINNVVFSAKVHSVGELKKTTNSQVCSLRIHQSSPKEKDASGNVTEWHSLWINVECWGKTAEAAQTLQKKDEIVVEGRLKYDTWEAKDGTNRSEVKLKAAFIHKNKAKVEAPAEMPF
jgi:single-stranded DNA-binding protein